jgi:hypothetical protein
MLRFVKILTWPLLTGTPTTPSCLQVPKDPLRLRFTFFMSSMISVMIYFSRTAHVQFHTKKFKLFLNAPKLSRNLITMMSPRSVFIHVALYANYVQPNVNMGVFMWQKHTCISTFHYVDNVVRGIRYLTDCWTTCIYFTLFGVCSIKHFIL